MASTLATTMMAARDHVALASDAPGLVSGTTGIGVGNEPEFGRFSDMGNAGTGGAESRAGG